MIANQILRKYGRNKTIKEVHKSNLIIPNAGVKDDANEIYISCLKLNIAKPRVEYIKINQIEFDDEYAYVSCTVKRTQVYTPTTHLGRVSAHKHFHSLMIADQNGSYRYTMTCEKGQNLVDPLDTLMLMLHSISRLRHLA